MAMREPLSSGNAVAGKIEHAGLQFSAAVAPFVSRMEKVVAYRASLQTLQGAWDMLSLLGQMSGIGAELGRTRESFQRLSETLLDNLACQQLASRLHELRARAQVSIDILVRNLFERTADIGFLATDLELQDFAAAAAAAAAEADEARCTAMRSRFAAYVAKYSVYDDIVVLAPDGRVLLRLDTGVAATHSRHPMVAEAQRSGCPYVESFGALDLLDGRRGLMYAAAIPGAGGQPIGVLCLSFRLEDEMRGIFARLLGAQDGVVLGLLDAQGEVLVGSDRWQLPVGAELPSVKSGKADTAHRPLLRFAGREYLRVGACSAGYQGYGGPGWQAVAMLPLEFAFRDEIESGAGHQDHAALARGIDTRHIFNSDLRGIPPQAQQIQLDLARSVWNGKLKRGGDLGVGVQAHAFAATFLHEVSRTGAQIRGVFDDAIAGLQTAVIAAILDEARFHASLAIDIMDRNLYERANDCRWWALTSSLRQALAEPEDETLRHASSVLRHINSLYTVYSLLVLFDTRGVVVATSDPARGELVGQRLDADMVRGTLALRDAQDYHVGPHVPSPLYGDAPTYVYAAAIRAEGRVAGAVVGGIAIVFDGQPQFAAMLADAMPRGVDGQLLAGAIGLFVDRKARVMASTDARFPPGAAAPFGPGLLNASAGSGGQQVVEIEGACYAAGVAPSEGYREYRGQGTAEAPSEHGVVAVVLLRLGEPLPPTPQPIPDFEPAAPASLRADAATIEIAAFLVGRQWFGLDAACVEEVLGKLPVTALSNATPHFSGVVRHQDKVVPVLDVLALLHPDRHGRLAGLRQPDGPLLLCRTATGQRLALRVDSLGLVFMVGTDQLKAWQAHSDAPALRLLGGRAGASEAMLTVLSIDSLWQSIGNAGLALALSASAANSAQAR